MSIRFFLITAFLPAILSSCFDYSEKVIFTREMSGRVEFDYTVPVHPSTGKSVISSLPADKDSVFSKYNKLFRNLKYTIEDFSVTDLQSETGPFKVKKRVRYSVSFRDPSELKTLLAGNNQIYTENGRLVIVRNFPSLKTQEGKPGFIMNRFDSVTSASLKGHYADFSVVIPQGFLLQSAEALTASPDTYSFRLPLYATDELKGPVRWSMTIGPAPVTKELPSDPYEKYPDYEADS